MTTLPNEDWTAYAAFAEKLADAAAVVTRAAFRKAIATDDKDTGDGFDPVTAADRDAEQAIRTLIVEQFPGHGIDGEEFGQERMDADWRWTLDPIDGTRAFISGLPTWGTLIALSYRELPVIGVIDQPYLRERYIGTPKGSLLNTKPVRTRRCTSLDSATMTTTDPELFNKPDLPGFNRLRSSCRLTRYGLDCYGYAMVASGHMDIVLESGLNSYDIAALVPVIRNAGGSVTDWSGNPVESDKAAPGQVLALGDPTLLDETVSRLTN